MTDERKAKLYDALITWVDEHCPTDDDFETALFHLGFTEVEVFKERLARSEESATAATAYLIELAGVVMEDIINELYDRLDLRKVVEQCIPYLDPDLDLYANLDIRVARAIAEYLI